MATLAFQIRDVLRIAKASISRGDLVVVGNILAIALTDTDAAGMVEVQLPGKYPIWDVAVHGADNVGNAAVAIGDYVYWDASEFNVDAVNGTKFGIALEAVTSGQTTTIQVLQAALGVA